MLVTILHLAGLLGHNMVLAIGPRGMYQVSIQGLQGTLVPAQLRYGGGVSARRDCRICTLLSIRCTDVAAASRMIPRNNKAVDGPQTFSGA